jgi:hypothetical protein
MTASGEYSWTVILEGLAGFLILYAIVYVAFAAYMRSQRPRSR